MTPQEKATLKRTLGLFGVLIAILILLGSIWAAVVVARGPENGTPTPTPTSPHSVPSTSMNSPLRSASPVPVYPAVQIWLKDGGQQVMDALAFDARQIAAKSGKSDVPGVNLNCRFLLHDVELGQGLEAIPDAKANSIWTQYLLALKASATDCIEGTKGDTMDSVDPALIDSSTKHAETAAAFKKSLDARIEELS